MRPAAVLLLALALCGCAAIFRPRTAPVTFESDPPGAQVYVPSARPVTWCDTPCTLRVVRSGVPAAYRVLLPGREPLNAELLPARDWGKFGILVILDAVLILPAIFDAMSPQGNVFPTRVHVVLPPEGQAPRVTITR